MNPVRTFSKTLALALGIGALASGSASAAVQNGRGTVRYMMVNEVGTVTVQLADSQGRAIRFCGSSPSVVISGGSAGATDDGVQRILSLLWATRLSGNEITIEADDSQTLHGGKCTISNVQVPVQ